MNIKTAYGVLAMQDGSLRKLNNLRFIHGDYEYRLTYGGGFACYIGIDRRRIGKRNFEYFGGVGAYHCLTIGSALKLIESEIEKRLAHSARTVV